MKRRIIAAVVALVLGVAIVPSLGVATTSSTASAASAGGFNPGYIISDALFYNGSAMTASAVQNFLNSQEPNCNAGYTCLKNYSQATVSRAAVPNRCAAYTGAASESAATIIANVGAACGISQEVLLVTLEKEEGLVTSSAPSDAAYRIAMGYGCPDTAACDTTYYGFFNQVWSAAKQFKIYQTSPTSFSIQAGRYNNILYSPNGSCGSSSVYVQNAATAGLYDYTPYQPDAAALANLYGTGDGCSSYGNRNFWRLFTDWFGSTTISSLVRTAASPAVYLVVNSIKYPVPDMTTFGALSPLGPLSIVDQTYLDALTTSTYPVGRILRSPDGTIYFIDAAIKLRFGDCGIVFDYGGSCDPGGYVNITDAQAAQFVTGPPMMSVLGTRDGPSYYMSDGVKHEILDTASATAAGLPTGYPILTEAALSALPYGAPVSRDGVFAQTSGTSTYTFIDGGKSYAVSPLDAALVPSSLVAGSLHAESVAAILTGGSAFTGYFTAPGSSQAQVVTTTGRAILAAPTPVGITPTALSQTAVNAFPDAGTIGVGSFVKSSIDSTIYQVTATNLRQVVTWTDLVALANTPSPAYSTLSSAVIAALPKGPPALGPGQLYRTSTDPAIYLIDGASNKIPISSFDYTSAAGLSSFSVTTSAALNSYTSTGTALTSGVQCGAIKYVATGGQLHALNTTTTPLFPIAFTTLSDSTCVRLTIGSDATSFIRTGSGSIYQLVGGQKRHVPTMARFVSLSAGQAWMQVTDTLASLIPTGPDA